MLKKSRKCYWSVLHRHKITHKNMQTFKPKLEYIGMYPWVWCTRIPDWKTPGGKPQHVVSMCMMGIRDLKHVVRVNRLYACGACVLSVCVACLLALHPQHVSISVYSTCICIGISSLWLAVSSVQGLCSYGLCVSSLALVCVFVCVCFTVCACPSSWKMPVLTPSRPRPLSPPRPGTRSRTRRTCSWWWTCFWGGTCATTSSRTCSSQRTPSDSTSARWPWRWTTCRTSTSFTGALTIA